MFVALGGDEVKVPVRYCLGGGYPTDLYYADLNGGSWDENGNGNYGQPADVTLETLLPEAYVGRIPVRHASEATAYIDKVIRYETASPDGFAHSMLSIAATAVLYSGQDRPAEYRDHDPVNKLEIGQSQMYIQNVQPYWQATPFHLYADTITPWDTVHCGDYMYTPEHMVERMNQGYHFVVYHGHGGVYNWDTRPGFVLDYEDTGARYWDQHSDQVFRNMHAEQLVNPIPFLLWSGGCWSSSYDLERDPTQSEVFIRNPQGGAVAVFGHTRDIGGNSHQKTLWRQIFEHRCPHLGRAFANSWTASVPNPGDVQGLKAHYIYVLLGDPAIHLLLAEENGREVQLFSPKGCEVIDPHDGDVIVRWNAAGTGFRDDDLVKLEYSPNSGKSWSPIPGAEALQYNSMAFNWSTGSSVPYGRNYRVRVSLLSDPGVCDISHSDVTIAKQGLLLVKSIGYGKRKIAGTHGLGLATNYTLSAVIGDPVTVIAPTGTDDVQFAGWQNDFGELISDQRRYTFTFGGRTHLTAAYEYRGPIANYYVNDEVGENDIAPGSDLHDGLSPQAPKRTIQSILETYPSVGWGAVIRVSKGSYRENLLMGEDNSGLTLLGAGAETTILDGGNAGCCLRLERCEGCVIRGLTVTNGAAQNGAGIHSVGSWVTIADCVLTGNTAERQGGGLRCEISAAEDDQSKKFSSLTMRRCMFVGNSAHAGGAIYFDGCSSSATITDCVFTRNVSDGNGGALLCWASDPTLRRCDFNENRGYDGGAIFSTNESKPFIAGCAFVNNTATRYGGGIGNFRSNLSLIDCTLSENSAHRGGGVWSCQPCRPVFTGCTFQNNVAGDFGGGMYNIIGSAPTLIQCVFSHNEALRGGAIDHRGSGDMTLTGCKLEGNHANALGGAVYNTSTGRVRFTHCLFSGNRASRNGGAMYVTGSCDVGMANCTTSGNTSDGGANGLSLALSEDAARVRLQNCILWDNGSVISSSNESRVVVTYSNIRGGWPGEGNIDSDPYFTDPGSGDYHLKSQIGRWDPNSQRWISDDVTSLCIDAGDPNSDWTAELWPHGKRINMGALGGTAQASMSLSSAGNIADLNHDSFVDYVDVELLIKRWSSQEVFLSEDLYRNGAIDFCDFCILAENWLWRE